MSHFMRMQKTGEAYVRKDEAPFYSGDTGGKDAGAGSQPQVQPSPSMHMHDIADRHSDEASRHAQVASHLRSIGLDKRAKEHQAVANEHHAAESHYRAAGDAAQDDSNAEGVASHLKAARACAANAQQMTNQMC